MQTSTVRSMLRNIYREGINVNTPQKFGNETLLPLVFAIKYEPNMVDRFIRRNDINLNQKDEENNTPLYYATQMNNLDIVEKLLKNGANPNIRIGNSKTLIELAIRSKNDKLVDLLLKYNTKTNINHRIFKHNLLHVITRYYPEILNRFLLDKELMKKINSKNYAGKTPIDLLVDKSYEPLLVLYGAKPKNYKQILEKIRLTHKKLLEDTKDYTISAGTVKEMMKYLYHIPTNHEMYA